jgi:hypothetical protein
MLRVLPALEAYAIANIATQNTVGGSPIQFLLGDLNAAGGTGMSALMGPQPGVLTLKELLTGSFNVGSSGSAYTGPTSGLGTTAVGAPRTTWGGQTAIEIVGSNFANNFGTIIVSSAFTSAGFRIANKVLAKPKSKMNKMLREVGLGSTVQL